MAKKFSRALAALGPAALTVLTAAGAAGAQVDRPADPAGPRQGGSAYYVEVELPDGTEHHAVLVCPGGGTHPHGTEVCGQLAEVNGEIAALTSSGGMCTMDYRPVSVRAHGIWNDDFHSYQGQFGNYCTAVDYTGGLLFDLAPR